MGVQNLHNSGRISLVLLFSSLWVIHSVGVGFDFIMIAPFLPSPCDFFFAFLFFYFFIFIFLFLVDFVIH